MIGYITGKVINSADSKITVLTNGIGYNIQSVELFLDGAEVELWVEATYKEGEPTFWGFKLKEEQQIFLALLKVNGIGPKTAFGLIARLGINNIISAVQNENFKLLKSGGVGDKLAQKLVIDLKGKLKSSDQPNTNIANINMEELQEALISLGMSIKELNTKISMVDFTNITSVEQAIKLILKK